MDPEGVEDSRYSAATDPSEPSRRTRRRRHHRRSFYSVYIWPYRRELRTALLFCIFIIATYLIWKTVVAAN